MSPRRECWGRHTPAGLPGTLHTRSPGGQNPGRVARVSLARLYGRCAGGADVSGSPTNHRIGRCTHPRFKRGWVHLKMQRSDRNGHSFRGRISNAVFLNLALKEREGNRRRLPTEFLRFLPGRADVFGCARRADPLHQLPGLCQPAWNLGSSGYRLPAAAQRDQHHGKQ